MRGGAFLNGKEGRVGFRTDSTCRAVTSLALLERRGLGSGLRTPSSQERDRGVEKCYSATKHAMLKDFASPFDITVDLYK